MKGITLSKGMTALVDDEDYKSLSMHKWHAQKNGCYYAMRFIKKDKTLIQMHHAIIGKPPKGKVTDHIDGNGLNNQKANLRHVTPRENQQNRHHPKTSMFPGVNWSKANKKWRSQIRIMGKRKHLGMFDNEIDASNAYKNAVNNLKGA